MSESTSNASTPTVAPHPFDQPSADVTLRTSDLFDFHVHSQILCQASPIFADMLSLPQPLSSSGTRPLVDVSENSKTLESLLRFCYPVAKPLLPQVADVASLLEAAMKYEMVGPLTLVIPDLLDFVPRSPLEAWAIASRTLCLLLRFDHSNEPPQALPVLEMYVDSATLSMLLALCYGGCAGNVQLPSNLRLLTSTLGAARTFGMERVAEAARGRWERAADANPLEAYFVAIEQGQNDLAAFAARKALEGPVAGVYVRRMEACPALAYHRLLDYHRACAQAARDAMKAAAEQLKRDILALKAAHPHPDCRGLFGTRGEQAMPVDSLHRAQMAQHLLDLSAGLDVEGDSAGQRTRSELGSGIDFKSDLTLAALLRKSSSVWPSCCRSTCRGYAEVLVELADSLPQAIADAVAQVRLELEA